MTRFWLTVMRFGAALYFAILSFTWLSVIGPKMALVKELGGMSVARGFGYGAFFIALFLALPQVWAWLPDERGALVANLNRAGRWAWGLGGGVLALVGVALAASSVFVLGSLGFWTAMLAVGTGLAALAGGATLVWAVWQAHTQQGAPAHKLRAEQVKRVAAMARGAGGRLSVGEVAAELGMPRPQAVALMKQMADEGWCEERVNSSGAGFYYFADFADPRAKQDIFEDEDGVVFGHEQASQADQRAHKRRG